MTDISRTEPPHLAHGILQYGPPMPECLPGLPDLPRYVRHRDNEWQGADHQNGPWRPIPAPQPGLPWKTDGPAVPESREPASVAAQASHLSPAAQAVLDAFWKQPGDRSAIAAALRAAADQVVPEEGHTLPIHIPSAEWLRFDERKKTRAEILALAAELEGTVQTVQEVLQPPRHPTRRRGA